MSLISGSPAKTQAIAAQYGIAADNVFTLAPGEMIAAITVPKTTAGRASTYHKVRDRGSYAFALAGRRRSPLIQATSWLRVVVRVPMRPWSLSIASTRMRPVVTGSSN